MAYKITGRVLYISTPQSFNSKSGNQFVKRDLIIMVRKFDQYTGEPSFDELNTPKFSFMNEKCSMLDQIKVGDVVIIGFDVRGRKYEKDGKTDYITDLSPFSVVLDKSPFQLQQQVYQQAAYGQPQQPMGQPQNQQTYQQPTQPQQGYPQSPQQTFYNQTNTSSPYLQSAPTKPQNGQPSADGDYPF